MNDPFLSQDQCVIRLMAEWEKHKKLIVAVDFDDTVFPFTDPTNTHNRVIDTVRRCQAQGFYIVVFTASAPERYDMIREFYQNLNIKIDSINKNPIPLKYGNEGKIYYNIFLDDRAGLASALGTLERVLTLVEGKA